MTELTITGHLSDAQRRLVTGIRAAATHADGVDPLNESADLAVHGRRGALHLLTPHGYAQLDLSDHSVQLVVDPQYRRRGTGRELLAGVLAEGATVHCWAFGTLPAAQAMAITVGAQLERTLLQMHRQLAAAPGHPDVASGVRLRSYRDDDLASLAAANAAAFAHHPEQGTLSASDLELRMAQPWWRPTDLIVAVDADDQVLGFHWTKVDPDDRESGEVYVLGVRPSVAGAGLGRTLLQAGLQHLWSVGVRQVDLFVEGDQDRVIRLYESASFSVVRRDSSYRCDRISASAPQE